MQVVVRVEQLAIGAGKTGVLKTSCQLLEFALDGIVGDRHAGFTKRADGRDENVKRGTMVRNWRQWSAVSVEELAKIAAALNLEELHPNLLGANITFSGCERLTQIPKGSAIWFEGGAVLTVEGENAPCVGPGKEIAKQFSHVVPAKFPKAARNLRGLVGVVYRPGVITIGEQAIIRLYEPFDALPKPPTASFLQ